MSPTFYEFFAGGGMARAGLGGGWSCLFANDFDPKKAASYAANWGEDHMKVGDVAELKTDDLPGQADLAWASFPCQDLSLAGVGAGLRGSRSGTFWPFWNLVKALRAEGRTPRTIVLENVYGTITSHGGKDFAAICTALAAEQYRFGAMLIDAVHFVPQSRPRQQGAPAHSRSPVDVEESCRPMVAAQRQDPFTKADLAWSDASVRIGWSGPQPFRLQLIRSPVFHRPTMRVATSGDRRRPFNNAPVKLARPVCKTVPADLRKILTQCGDIGVGADAVEPFEHERHILALLASRGDWDFLIVDRAAYGVREDFRLLLAG